MAWKPLVLGVSKCFKWGRPVLLANSIETACFSGVNRVPSGKNSNFDAFEKRSFNRNHYKSTTNSFHSNYPNWICVFFDVLSKWIQGWFIFLPVAFHETDFAKFPSPANNRNPFDSFFNENFGILEGGKRLVRFEPMIYKCWFNALLTPRMLTCSAMTQPTSQSSSFEWFIRISAFSWPNLNQVSSSVRIVHIEPDQSIRMRTSGIHWNH